MKAGTAEFSFALLIEEHIAAACEERLVRVHPRSVHAKHRLRHERRVKTVTVGHVLHDESKRTDVVRCNQCVVVSEIDFVLSRSDLVVRGLDVKAHLLEGKDDLAANVFTQINGSQIEVAAGVVRFGGGLARWPPLKKKEFGLGPAFIVKPFSDAMPITRFSIDRGHPEKGVPSGLAMSQMMRATFSEPA